MNDFERVTIDHIFYGYYKTSKLSNNQTASIYFIKEELQRGTEFHIAFAIANKKKYIKQWVMGERDVLSDKQTGSCGVEGLVWAKKQILAFEDFINNKYEDVTVCVAWADNRRRNVYERALGKYGYKITYRHGVKYLSKKVA